MFESTEISRKKVIAWESSLNSNLTFPYLNEFDMLTTWYQVKYVVRMRGNDPYRHYGTYAMYTLDNIWRLNTFASEYLQSICVNGEH